MRLRPESVKAQSGILLASFGKVNVDNEEEKKQGEGKGFAGLSSMVSDVDDVVSRVPKESQKARSEPPPKVVSSRTSLGDLSGTCTTIGWLIHWQVVVGNCCGYWPHLAC